MLKLVLVQEPSNTRGRINRGGRIIFCVPPLRSRGVSDRRQDKRHTAFLRRNAHHKVTNFSGDGSIEADIIKDSQSNFLVNGLARRSALVWLERIAKPAIFIL